MSLKKASSFLSGSGEMAVLTRNYDWSQTVLGTPGQWPQSLRTTLGIILNSKFPMFLFWGPEAICFYNDAYRPSLGNDGKHPYALGKQGSEVWPEIWTDIKPQIEQVLAGGAATGFEDQLLPIFRNGTLENAYWTYSFSAVYNDDGKINGVFVTCTETTKKVETVQRLQLSEERFQNLVQQATVGMIILQGEEMIVRVVNDQYGQLINRTTQELLGKPLFDLIPEAAETFRPVIDRVRTTGEPLYFYDQPYLVFSKGEKIEGYLNLVYQPYKEKNGVISGVMVLCHDVTKQVLAHQKAEGSELRMRNFFSQAPAAIAILDTPGFTYSLANPLYQTLFGRTEAQLLGKSLYQVFPEVEGQGIYKIFEAVYTSGKPFTAHDFKATFEENGQAKQGYYDFVAHPIKDASEKVTNIMIHAFEVTQQVTARRKIENSEQEVRSLVQSAPFPIGVYVGKEMRITLANQSILNIWGKGNDVIGKRYTEILPELENQEIFKQLDGVFTSGIPFHARNQRVDLEVGGKLQPFYFNYSFTPLFDADGLVYGVMNTAAEITDLVVAKQKAEQSEANLRNMILQSPVAMCIFKGTKHVVEIANDEILQIWGKTAEQMLHKPLLEGLPEVRNQGFDLLLDNVYATGETFKAFAQPASLPRNEGLKTIYVDFVFEVLRESDGTISGVMAVAIEVTEQVLARQKIEEMVQQRTVALAQANDELTRINQELGRSNANLEEFAHAASHDLKEPIRKIHFFSDKLKSQLAARLNAEEQETFRRIKVASERMSTLVDDLLLYSHVSQHPHEKEAIDLNAKIKKVLEDLELDIEQKKATISVGDLPVVHGYRRQLQQLFQNLISNALKYSKPGVPPQIALTSTVVIDTDSGVATSQHDGKTFHQIEVKDNGIGFDQKDAGRIFNVFTRLHGNSEYKGTGVGLSIVQKVVENHNGKIIATGVLNQGASFKVYLPKLEKETNE